MWRITNDALSFLILIRDAEKTTENLEDRLFDAGCDDALICFYNQSVYLEFDREAETAQLAIQSAFDNLRQAGFSDLVLQEAGVSSLSEIAARITPTENVQKISPNRCTALPAARRCILGKKSPIGSSATKKFQKRSGKWRSVE